MHRGKSEIFFAHFRLKVFNKYFNFDAIWTIYYKMHIIFQKDVDNFEIKPRNLKGGIGSLFASFVNAMGRQPYSLCGAHALERLGEMKSQKIKKGGLFDSVNEKGVLVKSKEQGWAFRSYSKR